MAENKFDIQQLFNDLSPEMQERARACRTNEELLQLAAEEDVEIPMEALKNVAGGCSKNVMRWENCGSEDIGAISVNWATVMYCKNCNSRNIIQVPVE